MLSVHCLSLIGRFQPQSLLAGLHSSRSMRTGRSPPPRAAGRSTALSSSWVGGTRHLAFRCARDHCDHLAPSARSRQPHLAAAPDQQGDPWSIPGLRVRAWCADGSTLQCAAAPSDAALVVTAERTRSVSGSRPWPPEQATLLLRSDCQSPHRPGRVCALVAIGP